jgi:hypothetical protein
MRNPIHLIAKTTFEHHGRRLTPGDPFTASPIEAAALRYQRKAIFAPARRVQTRAMAAETSSAPTQSDTPTRRRRYQRRDMVAED